MDNQHYRFCGHPLKHTFADLGLSPLSNEYLSAEDMMTLQKETGSGAFTELTFHDNATGELVTIAARSDGITYMPHYDWAHGRIMWKSVSVSFQER